MVNGNASPKQSIFNGVNEKIEDAHKKLAAGGMRPSGVRELINLLDEYNTPEAEAWQTSLLALWSSGYRVAVRHDGVAYTCGQVPTQRGRIAWMPADEPHTSYTVARNLEGFEFQFEDLTTVIDALYRGACDGQ